MQKDFDNWNELKKIINDKSENKLFKDREVWWCVLGQNVGYEQDGKGSKFSRPILILKKFSKKLVVGIPMSTKIKKENIFYYHFGFQEKEVSLILSQIRAIDVNRLEERLGTVSVQDFKIIKNKIRDLYDL